ncbi:MAG TPA: 3-deoxy-manno-octulosonate cytidylyltransferase [Lutibacter sp.]|nr:3-deoxy-manno-octulosonate cytidylyltransferase [Lutibacter sp.]
MRIVALIPARFDATRFPGKLLQDLAGKPVIIRTLEATLSTQLFDAVYVVTDSELIEKEILKHNGKVLLSKKNHATGSDRIAEAAEQINADIIINVQGDEPFVNKTILAELIQVFKEDLSNEIDVASLVFPISDLDEINNPNNVKVVLDTNNFASYFSRSPIPYPSVKNEAKYFQHIGIYAFRKKALEKFAKLPMGMLEKTEKLENLRFITNGMQVKMLLTQHKSIGIDTIADLEKARLRFKERKV